MAADPTAVALAAGFTIVQRELRVQGLTAKVALFSGESSKRYLEWVREVDKVRLAADLDLDTIKAVALQTTKGVASDYLTRLLQAQGDITWNEMKEALSQRFSDVTDTYVAMRKLRTLKQHKGDSPSTFAEYIKNMAEQAYPLQDMNDPIMQRQLVDIFVDGLQSDAVVRRLLRERPDTLDAALNSASREAANLRLYDMRRKGDEPMEVDVLTPAENARVDKMEKKITGLETKIDQVLGIMTRGPSETAPNSRDNRQTYRNPTNRPITSDRTPNNMQWTATGQAICWRCNTAGHIGRTCPQAKNSRGGPVSN